MGLIMPTRKMYLTLNFQCIQVVLKNGLYQYKEGIKEFTSTIHTVFGTALHEVLQHYLDVMYDQSAAAADRENLVEMFENSLREEYKIQYKKNNNQHFSSSEELREFFDDGGRNNKNLRKKT